MKNSLEKQGPLRTFSAIVMLAGALLAVAPSGAEDEVEGPVLTAIRMMFHKKLSSQMLRKCEDHQLGECLDRSMDFSMEEWDVRGIYERVAAEHDWCWMTEEDFNDLMERRHLVFGIRAWPRERVWSRRTCCVCEFEEDLYQAIGEEAASKRPTDIRVEIIGESPG